MKSRNISLVEENPDFCLGKPFQKVEIWSKILGGVIIGLSSIITPTTTTSVFGGNIWEAIIIIVLPATHHGRKLKQLMRC